MAAVIASPTAMFQFTPLREGRHNPLCLSDLEHGFQFTPLREGRPVAPLFLDISSSFNSRPCVRGDMFCLV